MSLRHSLGRWVIRADFLNDAARRRWRELSPFDRRWAIEPYMGFGTHERWRFGGRVLRAVEHRVPEVSHSAWRNLAEFWKRMESDEVPGARVRAHVGPSVVDRVADNEGYVDFDVEPAMPTPAHGWQQVTLELVEPAPRAGRAVTAIAQVLVPAPSARFGVISDIDDTVLWTGVGHKLRMLALLARSNARTRKPFKGVAAFYRALHEGAAGDERNPLFYVSNSPWNLYTPLVEFMSLQGLPSGPLMLRDFGGHLLFGGADSAAHKFACIERVLTTYPALPFVLIGDSGEQDPEIYRRVVQAHPGRVRVIYIRSVDPDPSRIEAVDRLIDEVRPTGVQLLLVADSEFAAVHAAAEGLIATSALADVRADKRLEPPASATA